MEYRLYSADAIVPVTSPVIKGGAVLIRRSLTGEDSAWKVIYLGRWSDVVAEASCLAAQYDEIHIDGILTPGLVNAHSHLQYSCMSSIGKSAYSGMEDWGAAFNEEYHSLSVDRDFDAWGAWAAEGARMLIETGTTAVADIVTDWPAAGALHDSRFKGICFYEAMNVTEDVWLNGFDAGLVEKLASIPKPPAAGVCPHAPYSVDMIPLRALSELARKRGYRLHIHAGETPMEAGTDDPADVINTRHGFKTLDLLNLRRRGEGMSAVKLLDSMGFFGPDCHIAHGIYLDEVDRAILRDNKTAVALCPRSNAVIGLDEAPVRAYLEEGNLIALGTDSLSSVTSLDLLDEAAALTALARKQGYTFSDLYKRVFCAATFGGARALGQHEGIGRIGMIEDGSAADFACFDVPGTAGMEEPELYEALVCSGPSVVATIIDGERRFSKSL